MIFCMSRVGNPAALDTGLIFLLGIIYSSLQTGMQGDFSILAVSEKMRVWLDNIAAENADLKLFQFHHNYLAIAMTRFRVHLVKDAIAVHLTVHKLNCTLGSSLTSSVMLSCAA